MAGRWDDTPSSSSNWPWREEMTLASSAERVERADDSFDFALAAASRSALREGERERERERRGTMDKTAKNESLLAGLARR